MTVSATLAVALSWNCIAHAQSVDRGPQRVGLNVGFGPFLGGVDEDGHHKDKGSAYSVTLNYGYLLSPHWEIGGLLRYWTSDTAVSDAVVIGPRLRGIATFGVGRNLELGLELSGGYLGMLTPHIRDDPFYTENDTDNFRDHYFSGFALAASVDFGGWFNERWGVLCGPSLTVGSAADTSSVRGFYLPERGGLISLEAHCGARFAP